MATSNKVDVLQQLREGITALTNSNAWLRYLDVQRRFHRYSWGNCMLINIQRPDATRIAGYRKWQELGRQVRKGERAITILAPVVYRQSADGEASRESTEQQSDLKVVRAFRTASVFDVAQTDGEPLPEIATRLLGDHPVHAWLRLQTIAGELGYSVSKAQLPGARNGDCNFAEYKIRVRDDLAPEHMVKTLAHEIGHVLLHHPNQRQDDISRDIAELEAESVAYIVCHELGIDSSSYSVGYITHWAGDGDRAVTNIERSAGRINKAARTVLDGLDTPVMLRDIAERNLGVTVPMETLCEEMTGAMSVGRGGMDWPEPVHHVNGYVVPSLLLTVPQACAALQVSRAQLYVMANKQHVIEMVHIGKLCRVPRASIENYVDNLRRQAPPSFSHGDFELLDGEGVR
jgi:predicted DNA-binding transcriptional regulator AlpA